MDDFLLGFLENSIAKMKSKAIDLLGSRICYESFSDTFCLETYSQKISPSMLKTFVNENEEFRERLFEVMMMPDFRKYSAFEAQRMAKNIFIESYFNHLDFDTNSTKSMMKHALGAINFAEYEITKIRSQGSCSVQDCSNFDWFDFILDISNVISNIQSHASFLMLELISEETYLGQSQYLCHRFVQENHGIIIDNFQCYLEKYKDFSECEYLKEWISDFLKDKIPKGKSGDAIRIPWDQYGEKCCELFIIKYYRS